MYVIEELISGEWREIHREEDRNSCWEEYQHLLREYPPGRIRFVRK